MRPPWARITGGAIRARSTAESISKYEGALQELEETAYWLELLHEGAIMVGPKVTWLAREADELIAIFVTCVCKAKQERHKARSRQAAPE